MSLTGKADTHIHTVYSRSDFAQSVLACPASAVLVDHTSTHQPFIVPSTAVMETESMWHRGGGSGGQGCGP